MIVPLAWTTRLIVVLALGAFAASLGLAMLVVLVLTIRGQQADPLSGEGAGGTGMMRGHP